MGHSHSLQACKAVGTTSNRFNPYSWWKRSLDRLQRIMSIIGQKQQQQQQQQQPQQHQAWL